MATKILTKKKFMDGKMTPMQLHAMVAWAGRHCEGCGSSKVALRIKILAPLAEVTRRNPELIQRFALSETALVGLLSACVQTKNGPYVMVSDPCACQSCKRDLERAAAKAPSWCIVEFDRGPSENLLVAVN